MDAVTLPLLSANDTIEDAVRQMNSFSRRFIVVELPGGYRTLSNREVLDAWKRGAKILADVKGGTSVAEAPAFQSVEELLRAPWDAPARDSVYRTFQEKGQLFAVGARPEVGRAIRVATKGEDIREAARSRRKVCVCQNCSHSDDSPPALDAGECPNCGEKTWRCA